MKLEFSTTLRYKEITHHQSGGRGYDRSNSQGWTDQGDRHLYRWAKRMMAKMARRNARIAIEESADAEA